MAYYTTFPAAVFYDGPGGSVRPTIVEKDFFLVKKLISSGAHNDTKIVKRRTDALSEDIFKRTKVDTGALIEAV